MSGKKRNTSIQEAIKYIDSNYPAKGKDVNAIWDIRNFLLSELNKEKELLKQAYQCGKGDGSLPSLMQLEKGLNFETYYNETYGGVAEITK